MAGRIRYKRMTREGKSIYVKEKIYEARNVGVRRNKLANRNFLPKGKCFNNE